MKNVTKIPVWYNSEAALSSLQIVDEIQRRFANFLNNSKKNTQIAKLLVLDVFVMYTHPHNKELTITTKRIGLADCVRWGSCVTKSIENFLLEWLQIVLSYFHQ